MKYYRSDKQRANRWRRRLIFLAISFFILGSLHVYKENWHSQLARRLVTAQERESKLLNEAGRLELELAQVAAYTRISKRAEEELGMTAMDYPADTLWIESFNGATDIRMAALYRISLGR